MGGWLALFQQKIPSDSQWSRLHNVKKHYTKKKETQHCYAHHM